MSKIFLRRGWSEVQAEDLVDLIRGVSYEKTDARSQPAPGLVAILRANNIAKGRIVTEDIVYVPEKYVSDLQYLRSGDTVIAASSGSRTVVGKAALADEQHRSFAFGAFCVVARPKSPEISEWFSAFTKSKEYRSYVEKVALGININNLRGADLKALPIPVAPIGENKRIVCKIDSLSVKSQHARDHLDHGLRLVERYKQLVLENAFAGILTGHELGLFVEKPLGEIIEEGPSNGWSPPSGEDAHGALSLKLTATTAGVLRLDTRAVKRIYETPSTESSLWLEPGDILVQRANALEHLGATAIYNGPIRKYIYPDLMMRIRVSHAVDQQYLWRFLNSHKARSFFRANATGIAGNMPKISGATLKRLAIPFPALEVRAEVIRRVDLAFGWIDRLASEAASARKLIDRLDQAILSKAFRGELVAQDPNDEPASVLLERIKAEKVGAPQPRKSRGRPRLSTVA